VHAAKLDLRGSEHAAGRHPVESPRYQLTGRALPSS